MDTVASPQQALDRSLNQASCWLFSPLGKSLPFSWNGNTPSAPLRVQLTLCTPHSSAFGGGWEDKTTVGDTVTFPVTSLIYQPVLSNTGHCLGEPKSNLFKHNLKNNLITAKLAG